jgi:hypothetical protein
MQIKGSKALMRWTLTGSRWWVVAHEPICPSLLSLVKSSIILCPLGAVYVYLCTLRLDLGAEGTYLRAERVESAINGVKSSVVVLSLSIDPLIEVLHVLMLSQTDVLQMLQNILHVGVRIRMTGRMADHWMRGSGSWLHRRTRDVLHHGVCRWCGRSRRRYVYLSVHDVLQPPCPIISEGDEGVDQ